MKVGDMVTLKATRVRMPHGPGIVVHISADDGSGRYAAVRVYWLRTGKTKTHHASFIKKVEENKNESR